MITRRKFLQTTAAGGAVLATSGLAAPAIAQQAAVKLGYVSPQTGPLAAFATISYDAREVTARKPSLGATRGVARCRAPMAPTR